MSHTCVKYKQFYHGQSDELIGAHAIQLTWFSLQKHKKQIICANMQESSTNSHSCVENYDTKTAKKFCFIKISKNALNCCSLNEIQKLLSDAAE